MKNMHVELEFPECFVLAAVLLAGVGLVLHGCGGGALDGGQDVQEGVSVATDDLAVGANDAPTGTNDAPIGNNEQHVGAGEIIGESFDAPASLTTLTVPEPPNLSDFIEDKAAAILLGKALFWDMQVGSDGIQACASCHFHAGADSRTKNVMSPGLLAEDTTFQIGGPNYTVMVGDFPAHKLADLEDRSSTVLSDSNDVIGSQGVFEADFVDILRWRHRDDGISEGREHNTPHLNSTFSVEGVNTRKVEPRNTPTVINAVFNFANFWDGRANNIFNGRNPFGATDTSATIFVNVAGTLVEEAARLIDSALASQAVGPPTSGFEMSSSGRDFPDLVRMCCASHRWVNKRSTVRTVCWVLWPRGMARA